MTDRSFQQFAQGYGSEPAQITFQIDGNTVFSGSITTFNQPWPTLPDPDFTEPALGWTWQDSANVSGTKQISIAVSGSPVLLAQTLANNPFGNAANLDQFSSFYSQEIDGITYDDPFSDEAIDGVELSGPFQTNLAGQWWWQIPPGSTFTATMHINAAQAPTPAEPDTQP